MAGKELEMLSAPTDCFRGMGSVDCPRYETEDGREDDWGEEVDREGWEGLKPEAEGSG